MKRLTTLCIAALSLLFVLPAQAAGPIVLKMPLWDQNDLTYYTKTDPIDAAYKKVNPNVSIELEKLKNSEDYENNVKIRASANELPDVMPLKPYMLFSFKDHLLPLNDLKAAKNNLYAGGYAVDGKIVGIPQMAFNEFVYYRKSVFSELGLAVPTTWGDFLAVVKKIKSSGKIIPIALGAKDVWPNYPYNEFMPCLESGNGNEWDAMAKDPAPFSPGKPFYRAYKKIKDLYDLKPFGSDPLGVSFEQSRDLFVAKKTAMIASGQWLLNDLATAKMDMNDLGLFFLPVRNNSADPFYATVMADLFMGVPKNGKNPEEAKKFVEWFFGTYYPGYVKARKVTSTVKGVTADDPILKQAFDTVPAKFIIYGGGGGEFTRIKDSISFDVKRIGQEMLAGADFDSMMKDLNKKWEKAQKKAK